MKKNLKRWLALLLSIALIASTGIYSSHSWLRANETGQATEDAAPQETQETQETQEIEVEPQAEEPEEEQKAPAKAPKAQDNNKNECQITFHLKEGDSQNASWTVDKRTFTFPSAEQLGWEIPAGYKLVGWADKQNVENATSYYAVGKPIKLDEKKTSYFAVLEVRDDIPYKVEHYVEKSNGVYELNTTVNNKGCTGAVVTASPITIAGYTYDTNNVNNVKTGTILANGSLVLKLYYRVAHKVTYTWSGLPQNVTLYNKDGEAVIPELPAAIENLKSGDSYIIDNSKPGTKVYKHDAHGNQIAEYTLSAWTDPGKGKMQSADITVSATWTSTDITVDTHNVIYEWEGLPEGKVLYDAAGEVVKPSVPASITGLVNNQPYTLTNMQGTVVYTRDEYGNNVASYTLGEWADPNNGKMGNADVKVKGTWTPADVTVPTWGITYSWNIVAAEGATKPDDIALLSQVTLPTDTTVYKNNQKYTVKNETYPSGYVVAAHDKYGNVNGQYTFSGWNTVDGNITGNLTIEGTWTFTETKVAKYNVTYKWNGLPTDGTKLYDESGNETTPTLPTGYTGLVKGQKYDVDTDMSGTVVYTHDKFGNKNVKYTLGNWKDPGNGKIKDADIIVSAEWKKETVDVDTWKITYEWDGDKPTGDYAQVLPADEKVYTNNESYTIDTKYIKGYTVTKYDEHKNVTGVYTFSGWDTAAGDHITKDLTVKGTWTFTKTDVAAHNVSYEWTGLPTDTLYDAAGNVVTPGVPSSITGLVNNQPYTVDRSQQGMVVYIRDAYGNNVVSYTLGTWDDPNNGVMGEADVKVTAAWEKADVTVPTYGITYNWTGDVPTGTYAQDLPTDATVYKKNQPYTVDKKFENGYTVLTYDDYNNVNGQYKFNGWNKADGNITENLTIEGTWTFTETTVAVHNVSYEWKGLPEATALYDENGNAAAPAVPASITGLVKGQKYEIDKTMPGTVVYTHDKFGNQNAKYTLGNWDKTDGRMEEADVKVSAVWKREIVEADTWKITYKWDGDVPKDKYAQALPKDEKVYTNNEPYTIDAKYTDGYTVTAYDEHNNVNGVYTFSGWNTASGNITENLTVKGTWTFTKTDVAEHNVTYEWTGLPEGTKLYNEEGTEVTTLHVPASITGLANNQPYTVDRSQEGTVVYTRDAYGNNVASYTLGTWNDPNNGVMGEADVKVTAVWEKADVTVPTYGITYNWTGDVPTGAYVQDLPTDTTVYKNNQPYTVDTTYSNGTTVTTYDAYGNVNGQYTFSGWNTADGNITENLTIEGTWTFTETTVAKHNVSYEWEGLPTEELFDSLGRPAAPQLPKGITGLVKGQKYTIDTTMPNTVVYTQDEYGNKTGKYTLGTWVDPNNGKMGETDIVVKAAWIPVTLNVPTFGITYKWSGDVPEGDYTQELPEDKAVYKNNQPYKVDKTFGAGYTVTTYDKQGNVNGVYTFSGWNKADGNITGDLTVKGTWTFTKTDVAAHNVRYEWTGLPTDVLYDEAGNVVTLSVPAGITNLVNNQTYTVDRSQENTVVYTRDIYGNNIASYTLGTWNDPNNGVMKEKDVLVTAEWTKADIEVPAYGITYNWTGDVPEGDYAQDLPTDATEYKNNQPYAVDKTFGNGYTVTTYDEYDNVNGEYTFSGWNTADGNITGNLTIEGTWTFTETTVEAHNVSYEWTGLPEGTVLYDEAGNVVTLSVPASITGLVKGQKYTVDKTMPGTVVYTYDEEGNVNAKYTLGAWTDPNSGKMGESDILVKAEWAREDITVDRLYNLTIHYVDAEGNQVADDYTGKFAEGEGFSVTSPTVDGFTPNYASVSSDENGMPARDLTFTVVYVANEVVTPGTPGIPVLIPPTPPVVTPGTTTPTTVAATPDTPLVTVPQAETALEVEGVVQLDEDGDYTVRQIQDEQTPLANRNLEDHDCCLLHFLLMIAALVVEAFYTRSMKKRQAKIFELREELEMEKQKKELGENDDAE